ncbi:MAG TPA: hypothetical protein VFA98_15350, partial [Thermoanaerobaculia bacterium]|nr:hypothetical protein [Thermoanaerobaculia bacterium]
MPKGIRLWSVLGGAALATVFFVSPALSQDGCTGPPEECGGEIPCAITCPFPPGTSTQKYVFGGGTHVLKVTATFNASYNLSIEFDNIDSSSSPNPDLDGRLNAGLGPANCVPYDGASFNGDPAGQCGFYHVDNVPDPSLFSDVSFRVFWNFPNLDQLHNVRLYRAPLDGQNYTCPAAIGDPPPPPCDHPFDCDQCYTQDITTEVFVVGNAVTGDSGVGGKSKPPGFSDFQVVDLTSPSSPAARVWIGLKKSRDAGILFDLQAVVKRNGTAVSSGTLFGAPGGGVGFSNANLLTIPLSIPAASDTFNPGDSISIKLFARDACVSATPQTGVARLWYDDAANSRLNEPAVDNQQN